MAKVKDRTGETRKMKNGLEATVIKYRRHDDIDIQFENGCIKEHVVYNNYKIGDVKCDMRVRYLDGYAEITNPNVNFAFLVDTEDVDRVMSAGYWSDNGEGYPSSTIHGKLHRFIMEIKDNSVQIDHKSRDRTDCRKSNLRACTHGQNRQNAGKNKNNTSGYKGVTWCKRERKWAVYIRANGTRRFLGYYHDKLKAAMAYDEAALKYHGDFACINEV